MPWEPPPRPEWVRAVNAGAVPILSDVASLPFTRDALLAEARALLGLDGRGVEGFVLGGHGASRFGDPGDAFVEPLDVLTGALDDEARLSVLGRWVTRRFLLRLLVVRAQVVAYVANDPGICSEVVHRPVVVTGAPRTGTTLLHALLAEDPRHRVPEGWELLHPVPPPGPDAFPDPARVTLADRELRTPALVTGTLDAIHEYGGRMHKECVSAMSFAFRSEEFTARYAVPSYVQWLQACDMAPAYAWHELVLQMLQRRWRDVHWVLKSPVHLHSLPTLLAAYPDARIVVTHRDPLTVLGSVTSLVATMRWAHSDHVDYPEIGRYHADLYGRALDGLVDLTESGVLGDRVVAHVHYRTFVEDPVTTMRSIADALGEPMTAATEQSVRAYVEAHPQSAHGGHRYSFADLGLAMEECRALFARYQEHFGVAREV